MNELIKIPEWENNRDNEVLKFVDFYISYNPDPCAGMGIFESDNGSDETAICYKDKFYILNGDFRATYKQLAIEGGIKKLLEYYNLRKDAVGSSWSNG